MHVTQFKIRSGDDIRGLCAVKLKRATPEPKRIKSATPDSPLRSLKGRLGAEGTSNFCRCRFYQLCDLIVTLLSFSVHSFLIGWLLEYSVMLV